MKKLCILFAFIFVSFVSFGQNKTILSKASIWFKHYSEVSFKDPYSYREMGIKLIDSVTNEEHYTDISYLNSTMDYQKRMLDFYKNRIEKEKKLREPYKVLLDFYDKTYNEYLKKYNDSVEKLNSNKTILSNMDDKTKKMIHHYTIKLDCYGKNSYGNEVLGRYTFNYDVKTQGFNYDSIKQLE